MCADFMMQHSLYPVSAQPLRSNPQGACLFGKARASHEMGVEDDFDVMTNALLLKVLVNYQPCLRLSNWLTAIDLLVSLIAAVLRQGRSQYPEGVGNEPRLHLD